MGIVHGSREYAGKRRPARNSQSASLVRLPTKAALVGWSAVGKRRVALSSLTYQVRVLCAMLVSLELRV